MYATFQCFKSIITTFSPPRTLRERSTELWDMLDSRFCNLGMFLDDLNRIIYMSSHTVDLSSLRSVEMALMEVLI